MTATLLILLAAALVLFVLRDAVWERLAGPLPAGPRDFATAPRSPTANDALACTPGTCPGTPDIDLPDYAMAPAALMEAVDRRIAENREFSARLAGGAGEPWARYLFHSPLMHFPDLIDVEAVPLENGRTGLRAYARARLGSSDFGANRKRLAHLLDQLSIFTIQN